MPNPKHRTQCPTLSKRPGFALRGVSATDLQPATRTFMDIDWA